MKLRDVRTLLRMKSGMINVKMNMKSITKYSMDLWRGSLYMVQKHFIKIPSYRSMIGSNLLKDDLNFWQMEDDINFLENRRRPQFFGKWKTALIVWQLENNLYFPFGKDVVNML